MMSMAGPASLSPSFHRRSRPEDAAMYITVSDPVQHSEGMNRYTSYRVDVRPPQPGSSEDPQDVVLANIAYSAVLRRYSDFLWLYERLHMERAGAVVPPIPEKQPVGRFSPAFIEDRRMNLERFLRRVSVHPELADAQSLDIFLRADDMTFQTAKQAKGGDASLGNNMSSSVMFHPQQPKKEGFSRWFAEAKTSISGDLVRSPDDDIFEEINRYIVGLDSQMRNVSNQASALVRKGKEIANGLFEFGLAFNLLGQSEADALGDSLGKMGETADRLSVLSAEHAQKEMSQFEEPLQDYIKLIHAVKIALQRRQERRVTYSTCLADVEAGQTNVAKLRAQFGAEGKIYAAEMSLRRAQEACEVAREEYAVVSQRVLREVDRFKREKAEDMRRTVLEYINLQVDYNKRMEQIWSELIPQLEKVQLDNNSNAITSNGDEEKQESSNYVQQRPLPASAVAASSNSVPPPMSIPGASDPSSMISVQYRETPGSY